MRCRLLWPTGAYTAAPLVDWRSENGGQYAQAKTMGIIRFVTSLFYFYPDFKWVPASNYRYCIKEICLSDGCRSTLPEVKLRKFDGERRLGTISRKLRIWLYRYWTTRGGRILDRRFNIYHRRPNIDSNTYEQE